MIRNVSSAPRRFPSSAAARSARRGAGRGLPPRGLQRRMVALPFKWYPPAEIVHNLLAWRCSISRSRRRESRSARRDEVPGLLRGAPAESFVDRPPAPAGLNLSGRPTRSADLPEARASARSSAARTNSHPEARKVFRQFERVAARLRATTGSRASRSTTRRLAPNDSCRGGGRLRLLPKRVEAQKRQTRSSRRCATRRRRARGDHGSRAAPTNAARSRNSTASPTA